jgi:hypothetical protein
MKFKLCLVFLIFLINSFDIIGQKGMQTFVGAAYTVETNFGFYGLTLSIEEEIKLKPKISIIAGGNFFLSENIPDRKVGSNLYNRSFLGDIGLRFSRNLEQKGLYLSIGPTFKLSKIRHVVSYSLDSFGEPTNINYEKLKDLGLGVKTEIGYKIPISDKLSSALFVDFRIIDVFFEPTFLGVGYKFGF